MFPAYFKIYIVQNNSGGNRKRHKRDYQRGYDFSNTVTLIYANSHFSNSSIFPETLRACNDQKIILEIRKDSPGKKKDV